MKVIIIGAGVVGVTTAWYLTELGHEVTVVERLPGVACEASYGNAGGICPSFAGPWAAPGMPLKALKWLFDDFPPLKIRPKLDLAQWRWLLRFLGNCNPASFAENKARMQRVAHYSRHCLSELRLETGIRFDEADNGVLQVFQTEEEAEGGRRSAKVLLELGIAHRFVDTPEIIRLEPALKQADVRFAGALHLPEDGTGDSHLFTRALADLLIARGCRFQFDTSVTSMELDGGRIAGIRTRSKGGGDRHMSADAFVLAAGAFVPALLKPLGIDLPVYPVKGYSITADISDDAAAPVSSVMDEHSKVMVTRLGTRLRAAGVAEIAGYDRTLRPEARHGLIARVKTLFPNACDYQHAEFWCGFRPMTPDGPAIVGQTKFANLYLNAGHGSNGWTQSCGTGRILADMMSGRTPDVDP
ncbi:MAG: D-amino acid dehydrogenase [Allorhizobium sp.]